MSAPAPSSDRPTAELRGALRVPFRDVDMHGHVHNAVFLSYFESAINDFIRENQLAARFGPVGSAHAYHVKKVDVTYEAPAFFEDELAFRVRIDRVGRSSLTFAGEIVRLAGGATCAHVSVVWVCVDTSTGRSAPIPDDTREALEKVAVSADN